MSGGTVISNSGNMWIHQGSANSGTSTIEMTGGTWSTNKTFTFLNRNTSAHAWLNIYGGTFANTGGWRRGDSTTAYTDAQWGITVRNGATLVWPWNKATTIGYITATTTNLKTGDPKQGLMLSWNTANTIVTAVAKYGVATPLAPLDGQTVQPGTNLLKWTMPTSYTGASAMTCDVYFGTYAADVNGVPTDPNGDNLTTIATGLVDPNLLDNNVIMEQAITAVYTQKYQWRVDCHDPTLTGLDPNHPNLIKSKVMYMSCQNQAPVVTYNTSTTLALNNHPIIGLRNGTATFATTASATDDSLPPAGPALTYAWTQVGGPAVAITQSAVGGIANRAMSATLTAANTYTFRMSVYDGELTGTADVVVTVYADRCAASKARTGYTALLGDLNADCWVSFADVALMTNNWLVCNNLNTALCY